MVFLNSYKRSIWVMVLLLLAFPQVSQAAYGKVTENSRVDPEIMRIDEKKILGEKIPADFVVVNEQGQESLIGDRLGKPMVLALSYYRCDGACSVLNRNLWTTLQEVERWKIGEDFSVLTVSFDAHDNPDTLKKFKKVAGFSEGLPQGWEMTTLKDPENIKRLTDALGYKFFWSPRDAIFLHPNVYIMVSPKGRVTRFLYGANITGNDMETSITKAYGEELSAANVINFLVGACYSYNYKDGKYTINIPIIIALVALVFGLLLLIGSFLFTHRKMKRRRAEVQARRDAALVNNDVTTDSSENTETK